VAKIKMKKGMKIWALIVVLVIAGSIFSGMVGAADTSVNLTFEDDFSEHNLNNWIPFGSPSPRVLASVEGRNGVFDNNGDGWCNSGVVSKDEFSFPNGFTMESDIYLKVTDVTGCWDSPAIGLTRQNTPTGTGVCPTEDYPMGVIFGIDYVGDACWASPEEKREHAYFSGGLYTEDGEWESIGDWVNADDYINDWHNFKIVVESDRYVKFYIDNELIYSSTNKINEDVLQGNKIILTGRSSGSAGKSYHDYIKVYTTTPPPSGDSYEPDDTYSQATLISTDGTHQAHNFEPAGDHDWVKFNAVSGTKYTIEASNLGSGSDTYIYLYDRDGTTEITHDDDGGEGYASRIVWNCPTSGTYYMMIRHYDSSSHGPDTQYDISIAGGGAPTRLYHSTIDDEINIEVYGPFEPGLNTRVNYEVLITPTDPRNSELVRGKVYFAYPDNNTEIYPIELWFKTRVDHNWHFIDMAQYYGGNAWAEWGIDTFISAVPGIPCLWSAIKIFGGYDYPTPPEGTAYFDDNAYDLATVPIEGICPYEGMLCIWPDEGARIIIPLEFTQRRTTDLHFFVEGVTLRKCDIKTSDIIIYINAGV
jgi:hypothetical protein